MNQLIEDLTWKDNHKSFRADQLLSNLAISDHEKRMLVDFAKLYDVAKNPKFVMARHSLQRIWQVVLAGEEQKDMIMNHLIEGFKS
ncbi:MAG: hypothetical protein ACLRZR_01810 [Turicibacter sp.]|uniref:hypothetical protein n=1 Tax=Turicibacter bilis TaxID=2735723 RepID=UPI001930FAF6